LKRPLVPGLVRKSEQPKTSAPPTTINSLAPVALGLGGYDSDDD